MNPEWVGYLAAILTTVAYMPQTIKAVRERNTISLSMGMYILSSLAALIWLWYGSLISNWPIMLCNLIIFLLSFTTLIMKIRCG